MSSTSVERPGRRRVGVEAGSLLRTVALPPDVDRVEGVYVDGVPQAEGVDYDLEPGLLRFRRPVRLPERMTGVGRLLEILCAGVYPEGRSVDVVVRRRGRRETITPDG